MCFIGCVYCTKTSTDSNLCFGRLLYEVTYAFDDQQFSVECIYFTCAAMSWFILLSQVPLYSVLHWMGIFYEARYCCKLCFKRMVYYTKPCTTVDCALMSWSILQSHVNSTVNCGSLNGYIFPNCLQTVDCASMNGYILLTLLPTVDCASMNGYIILTQLPTVDCASMNGYILLTQLPTVDCASMNGYIKSPINYRLCFVECVCFASLINFGWF